MATELYRVGEREKQPKKGRKRITWLISLIIIILLLIWLYFFVSAALKPKTVIKQAKETSTNITYEAKTKHWDEPDFGIDLPATWNMLPRPEPSYQTFTWSNGDSHGEEQEITVYQDTIPVNYAVNKALILSGSGGDHVELQGQASDDCVKFTKDLNGNIGESGAVAKWQDVPFICDHYNRLRDVIGTSSTDGINTVNLKGVSTGQVHKFFFTYTNHSVNPDYTLFYGALSSLKMK